MTARRGILAARQIRAKKERFSHPSSGINFLTPTKLFRSVVQCFPCSFIYNRRQGARAKTVGEAFRAVQPVNAFGMCAQFRVPSFL